MGMAASQARFLSLTARKSNVEYEGQQVNQQRTALANESANLYNKLTSIEVPTPPATSDYYETVYTFTTSELDTSSSTGSTQYTLNNIYTTPDGLYAQLQYTQYNWEAALSSSYRGDVNTSLDDNGNKKYSVNLVNGSTYDATEFSYEPSQASFEIQPDAAGKIMVGGLEYNLAEDGKTISSTEKDDSGNPLYTYNVTDNGDGTYTVALSVKKETTAEDDNFKYEFGGVSYDVTKNANGTYSLVVPSGVADGSGSVSGKYVDASGNSNSAVSYLSSSFFETTNETQGKLQNQPILAYVMNGQTYFVSAQEFVNGSFASSSYVQSVGKPQYVDYPCSYSTAASGRYQTLTVTDDYGQEHTFSLDVQNVQDEEAYAQAMLDYEYEQARYNKEIQDINAKTEKLQQEDRTLELRLKQLDTEQNAIATEMDAVSKVIEDNIEATFKTFA